MPKKGNLGVLCKKNENTKEKIGDNRCDVIAGTSLLESTRNVVDSERLCRQNARFLRRVWMYKQKFY